MVGTSALAEAVLGLAEDVGADTIVDLGAADGGLLGRLARLEPAMSLLGVDIRPPRLRPAGVEWRSRLPSRMERTLVVAHELLDDVPMAVAERDDDGELRHVLVDPLGSEQLGPRLDHESLAWSQRWWPAAGVGDRVEVGTTRDRLWASVVGSIRSGGAVAIDYGHTTGSRPPFGSLRAYANGRTADLVPDHLRNITADVAVDSLAAAVGSGAPAVTLTQPEALRRYADGARIPGELVDPHAGGRLSWVIWQVHPVHEMAG